METQPDPRQAEIDRYLLGTHSDPEAFARRLDQDPDLMALTNQTRQVLAAVTLAEDARLKSRLQKLEGRQPRVAPAEQPTTDQGARIIQMKPRRQGRSRWYLGAAAAALLLFVAGYFLLSPAGTSPDRLAMAAFEPYDNIAYTITKSGTPAEEAERLRAAAYTAYEMGDYAEAEQQFGALNSGDTADRFYLAQSLLAQEDFVPAAELLTELSTTPDFSLAPEARYYAALAYLGMGQTERARTTLSLIATQGGHPMRVEAIELLDRL